VRLVPDTSVWVDLLRRGGRGPESELYRLLETETILACGPVVAEMLSGASEEQRDSVWHTVVSLPWADLDATGWRETGNVASALRRRGRTVPLTDVMIAVASVRARAQLWTTDEHFRTIQDALPGLELYEPRLA